MLSCKQIPSIKMKCQIQQEAIGKMTWVWEDLSSLDFFHSFFRAPSKRCVREVAAKTDFKTLTRFLLPHGFIPPVVPEVDTVTVGGAISGLVMESSSFRYGFVHNAVTSMAAWSDWRGWRVGERNEERFMFFSEKDDCWFWLCWSKKTSTRQ